MRKLAIITARGGSKRIPGKNSKIFCGKPIIAYSIQAALDSQVFNEVIVYTDSEEIAEVSKQYGATVPFFRSEDASNDYATTADVLEEVFLDYEIRGRYFDIFSCIYPTAPFVTSSKLRSAMNKFLSETADLLISVVRFGYPLQRAFIFMDVYLNYQFPENASMRSQVLVPYYHDNGQFYISRAEIFRTYHSLVLPKPIQFLLSEEVQDIDAESDWRLAEMKFNRLNSSEIIGEYRRLNRPSAFFISGAISAALYSKYREAA